MILPYRDRTIIENFKQSLNLAQFCSHIIIAHSHPNFLSTFSFHISCNQPSHTNRICAPNNNLNTARTTHICTSQQYIPQHHYIKTHSNPTHVILYLKTRKGSFISFSFFGRRRCNLCVNKLLHISDRPRGIGVVDRRTARIDADQPADGVGGAHAHHSVRGAGPGDAPHVVAHHAADRVRSRHRARTGG